MKKTNGRGVHDNDGFNPASQGSVEQVAQLVRSVNQSGNMPKKPVQAAKGQAQESILFKKGAARPPAVKVPTITPEIIKIGSKKNTQALSATPTDSGISQTVSDRGLAHVMSGGIGYNKYSA